MAEVFRCFGINRLRMGTDGDGVTTLVAGAGCPLACRYCLNPQCAAPVKRVYTAEQLFEKVSIDSLYFEATLGGVVFGGGEPLLQSAFIREFASLVKEKDRPWRIFLETSCAVPRENLALLDGLIDGYIVDCKDLDDGVYLNYTGKHVLQAEENIAYLAERFPDRLTVKTPLIPGFNDETCVARTEEKLRAMGVIRTVRLTYKTDINKS